MTIKSKRSAIGLSILTMLFEAPMHPYRMQQLIKERGKDEVINVSQRASLYQTINRLERDGLIVSQKVSREENRPERTTYELTKPGEEMMFRWMREILSTPGKDYPEFPAALSVLAVMTVEDAQRQLEYRLIRLEAELKRIDEETAQGLVPAAPVSSGDRATASFDRGGAEVGERRGGGHEERRADLERTVVAGDGSEA